MKLNEAKQILKRNGYIIEDTDTLQDRIDTADADIHSAIKRHNGPGYKKAVKDYDDAYTKASAGNLKDKISNAKSFNMISNIKTYEKQFIAKLKELGLTITGSNRDMVDKRLTHYDVEINDKGEREEGFVCLYVEDGELWVNYELFSGISGNDPYEEFINDTLPLEIKNFKKYADEPRYF